MNRILKINWHIKPRIFAMLTVLLLLIFIAVIAAFNVFIRSYIQSDVGLQLESLAAVYGDSGNNHLEHKSKLGARGDVLILDGAYTVLKYEGESSLTIEEVNQFCETLKLKRANLESIRNMLVTTASGEYYASSMLDAKSKGAYLVFFVDVTVINRMVDMINIALIIILSIALIISFIVANSIANSITSPVKQVAAFARQIGKGDFRKRKLSFVDVEFQELDAIMNSSAEKLSKYDVEQRSFFQNVSHELRTPLMAIKCHAEGIEYGLMDTQKSSHIIIAETDRLAELVEDLLYISRMDSITQDIPMQTNDLRETLEICAENMKSIAVKKGVAITLSFDESQVLLSYNEKHMYRAVLNLLSNAIRYAKTTVTVGCKILTDQIVISVTDDGDGISPNDMPHIFERFYKGEGGKHGIGLSIVKSVVALHGGNIEVSCDSGTTFTIAFSEK